MTLLILGLALWVVPHHLKRLAPDLRAGWGDKAKGPLSLAMLAGIVLMVIGYRAAEGTFYWGRSPALVGVNNLLMLIAVYLFAAAGMKTALARKMRHPMLWGHGSLGGGASDGQWRHAVFSAFWHDGGLGAGGDGAGQPGWALGAARGETRKVRNHGRGRNAAGLWRGLRPALCPWLPNIWMRS